MFHKITRAIPGSVGANPQKGDVMKIEKSEPGTYAWRLERALINAWGDVAELKYKLRNPGKR